MGRVYIDPMYTGRVKDHSIKEFKIKYNAFLNIYWNDNI